MGERFVVVPVDGGGGGEHLDAVVADPAQDTGGSSSNAGPGEEKEAFEAQDSDAVVPILEYDREPNKYGKTAAPDRHRVPLLISPGSHLSITFERIRRLCSLELWSLLYSGGL